MVLTLIDQYILADFELVVCLLAIDHLFSPCPHMVQCMEHEGPVESEFLHQFLDGDCLFPSHTLFIKVRDVAKELWVVSQVQVEWAELSVRNGGIVDDNLY